mgnify:CR=1 FL=1
MIVVEAWDKKEFLVQDSILSMAAYHAKIKSEPNSQYQLRISDCNNTIKLWGNINSLEDIKEGMEKLETLKQGIISLQIQLEKVRQENF